MMLSSEDLLKGGNTMVISIFTLIGAGVCALAGAIFTNTDIGQKVESTLQEAVDTVKQVVGKG